MQKKIFILFFLIISLLVSGFGCKGLSKKELVAIKPVTLDFWTIYDDTGELAKYAQEYKQIRPYVTVNIRKVRYEEFDKLFTNALADDVAPDIISVHTRWLKKYQNRLSPMPATVKVSRMIKTGTIVNEELKVITETAAMPNLRSIKNDYVDTVYSDVIRAGRIYGLPLALDTLAIYYNKDLLDRSGVPEPPKTWEEFVEAVKKSSKFDQDGKIIQSGVALGTGKNINHSFDIFSLFMAQSGVKIADGSVITFADTIGNATYSHPFFKALNFYTDFARANKESYSWNEQMGNAFDLFTRGKTVFYFGFGYEYPQIRSRAPSLNIEIIPVPQLNKELSYNVANYWIESVVKKSKHQNEAWDFIRFITTPEKVKDYCKAVYRPTPLRSQINEQLENVRIQPFVSQVLFAKNWYDGQDIDSATEAINKMISNYLKPFEGEPDDKLKRDKQIIFNAVATLQQTM